MKNERPFVAVLENFIIVAIVLVIVQTFLHEYSRVAHWSLRTRNILTISGFVFDLIFSVEFIVRLTASIRRGDGAMAYINFGRGWVDLLSSLPLLLLDSGPALFLLLFATGQQEAAAGIGVLNVLKVVKAVRVTRILRLLRVIKIFGKIHNAESSMAQHHSASISTVSVFSIVITLMVLAVFDQDAMHKRIEEREKYYTALLQHTEKAPVEALRADTHVIRLESPEYNESFADDEYITSHFSGEDLLVVTAGSSTLTVSIADIHAEIASMHIHYFVIIIAVVLAIMLFYTRHFVQTISDPLHIMNRGFRKRDYNLQVKIQEAWQSDEVFQLARFYNEHYLPAKQKKVEEESTADRDLSMDDLLNFKG